MLLRIPIEFTADVKLFKARTTREMVLRAYENALIKELKAQDAPIVLWGATPDIKAQHEIAFRFHDGGLWRPIVQHDDLKVDQPTSARGFLRRWDSQYAQKQNYPRLIGAEAFKSVVETCLCDRSFQGPGGAVLAKNTPCVNAVGVEAAATIDDAAAELDMKRVSVAEFAANTLMIEGVAHRRVAQPVIGVMEEYQSAFGLQLNDGSTRCLTYPDQIRLIDGWSEATEMLESAGGSIRKTRPPEILQPDLLDLEDTLGPAARATADEIIITHYLENQRTDLRGHKTTLITLGCESVLAWIDLRDARSRGAETPELLELMLAYATTFDQASILHPKIEQHTRQIARFAKRAKTLNLAWSLSGATP